MAACLARSSLVSGSSGEARSFIEPEMSMTSRTRAALRCWLQRLSRSTSTGGFGVCSRVWGWFGSTPLSVVMGVPDGHLGVARPEVVLQHAFLVVRLLHEVDERLRPGLLVGAHPRRVEDEEGVVGEDRALLRVDGHQLGPGWAGLLAGVELPVRVAGVVVDDRLLLDGERRGVLQGGALLVGPVPVVEVGQGRVAVVVDRGLDRGVEGVGLGLGQVLEGQVAGLAGGGVVLGDEGRQARGGEVGVGLAQAERPPFGVPERGPARLALGQVEDVAPPERLVRASPAPRPWAGAWR